MIRKWLGKGILGVGQRRGLFAFGELLILVYNSRQNKVVTVQNLRGFTIFARFVEIPAFSGLSLEELRSHGTSKRCALIQAIDAVEKHLRDSQAKAGTSKPRKSKAGTGKPRKSKAKASEARASGAGTSEHGTGEVGTSADITRPHEPDLFSYGYSGRIPQVESAETEHTIGAQGSSGLEAVPGDPEQEPEAKGETSAG